MNGYVDAGGRLSGIGKEIWDTFKLSFYDGIINTLKQSKIGKYGLASAGFFTRGGPINPDIADTLVSIEDDVEYKIGRGKTKKVKRAYVAFAKTYGDELSVDDIDFDLTEEPVIKGIKGDKSEYFVKVGSLESLYDYKLFEKSGAPDTFPGYRGAEEVSLIREEMIKDAIRYYISKKPISEKVVDGKRISITRIERGADLGLGAYFLGQVASYTMFNKIYKGIFKFTGKLLSKLPLIGEPAVNALAKNEGVILSKYVEFTDILNRALGYPEEIQLAQG